MPALTREARIYLAIWRKAITSPDETLIEFPDISECINFTRNMYRAIKPYRDGRMHDETLTEAIEKYAIWHPKKFEPGEKPYVTIRPRAGLAMAESLAGQFGLTDDDLLTPGEKSAMKSAEKVAKDLDEFLQIDAIDEPPSPPRASSTPFYKRV